MLEDFGEEVVKKKKKKNKKKKKAPLSEQATSIEDEVGKEHVLGLLT